MYALEAFKVPVSWPGVKQRTRNIATRYFVIIIGNGSASVESYGFNDCPSYIEATNLAAAPQAVGVPADSCVTAGSCLADDVTSLYSSCHLAAASPSTCLCLVYPARYSKLQ